MYILSFTYPFCSRPCHIIYSLAFKRVCAVGNGLFELALMSVMNMLSHFRLCLNCSHFFAVNKAERKGNHGYISCLTPPYQAATSLSSLHPTVVITIASVCLHHCFFDSPVYGALFVLPVLPTLRPLSLDINHHLVNSTQNPANFIIHLFVKPIKMLIK